MATTASSFTPDARSLDFLDDHGPPFKANPHFLYWAPALEAPDCFVRYVPGKRPQLIFHQPADYWHKPPEIPTEAWTREFEIDVIREPGQARDVARYGRPTSGVHRADAG